MNANQLKENMLVEVTDNKYGHKFPIGHIVRTVSIKRSKKVSSILSEILTLTCVSASSLDCHGQWLLGESEVSPIRATDQPNETPDQ